MSVNATAGTVKKKICVKCGRDVTGAPRMKDHDGRYWCVPCGEADRRHQAHALGGICEGCGESFSKTLLLDIAGQSLCPTCRKKKFAKDHGHSTQSNGGGGLFGSIKSLFRK